MLHKQYVGKVYILPNEFCVNPWMELLDGCKSSQALRLRFPFSDASPQMAHSTYTYAPRFFCRVNSTEDLLGVSHLGSCGAFEHCLWNALSLQPRARKSCLDVVFNIGV